MRDTRFAGTAGLLLALLISGSIPVDAQRTGSVRGVVLDALSGVPLAQVEVTIADRPYRATTNDQGVYRFDAVTPGPVRLIARKLGFHAITTSLYTVESDSVVTVDFKLAPLTVELEPLEVEGTVSERRAAIGARVLKGEDLPRGDILTALQGSVPSLRTSGRRDDTRVRLRLSAAEVLYVIDGTVITPPLRFSIDTREVDCVEVRPGYRAAQEFRLSLNSETYSGVVLIWTRGSREPRPRECSQ